MQGFYFMEVCLDKTVIEFSKLRPVICVQGLGFVGVAMALAISKAVDVKGFPLYNVIGVDLPTDMGSEKTLKLNQGILPFNSTDDSMSKVLRASIEKGNFVATTDFSAFKLASVIVVDVPLNLSKNGSGYFVNFDPLRQSVRDFAYRMQEDALVLIETTVPPGTTEKVVAVEIKKIYKERDFDLKKIKLAHTYERVMPGRDYLDSIINYWRVYAGINEASANACEDFLRKIINVKEYPLTRLEEPVASETAKILENSYRATNIAFMEEWGRFAESIGVNMYDVVDAIRKRPTHSNIRTPGFGVGGYCLTKDPMFAGVAARDLYNKQIEFEISEKAVSINEKMPLVSLKYLEKCLGNCAGKKILLAGISYRQDVGDTRFSPAETFVKAAVDKGAILVFHDPMVSYWIERGCSVSTSFPEVLGLDAVVFAVPHAVYRNLDLKQWLSGKTPVILDAFNVLSKEQYQVAQDEGCQVLKIGCGI